MTPLRFTRLERAEQLPPIAALAKEIWEEFYTPILGRAQVDHMVAKFQSADAMAAQLRDGYEYFAIERGDELVGYFAVRGAPDGSLFLSKLYLRADARGTGAGRASMAFIEQLARERGATLLWLTVNKRNPSVKRYERLGFHIASELVVDIGGGFVMDDFRMEKRLR